MISLKEVYNNIQTIADTSSTNSKIDLLKEYLKDPIFRKVIWCCYSQTVKFKVKQFPDYKQVGFCDRGWEFVLPILKQLASQNGADNTIKNKLFQAAAIDKETYDIVRRICDKDMKAGFGGVTINKARPGTVKLISYMRCSTSKFLSKISYEPHAIAQCKADGAFANLVIGNDNKVSFITRSGRVVKCLQHLKSMIKNPLRIGYGIRKGIDNDCLHLCAGKVYQGELRVRYPDGKVMSRKAGNGIINECIHGTVDPKIAKRIFYTVWDSVLISEFSNGYSDVIFNSREFIARSLVNVVGSEHYVQYIKSERVTSEEEAFAFYRKMRSEGEEGCIIKNVNGIWEDNQSGSQDCVKIKHSFECELKVVGWNYGKKGTRFEKIVGSVMCESECGKIKVNISGLLDSERSWDWDMMIGTIITVEAESVIESKNKDTYSLYTPSFIEPREDREIADTLERIMEISRESKKTKRRKQ